MTEGELRSLIEELQERASETQGVEAKAAKGGLPSLQETVSAFSNSPGGGVILLGVSEEEGFAVTGIDNPAKIQADLVSMCATELTPPVRPIVSLHTIDGMTVCAAEIPEREPEDKPCFCTARGKANGSYVRSGDADQRLTPHEVFILQSRAGRPQDDLAPVPAGSIADFDPALVRTLLERVRSSEPRAFAGLDDEACLLRLRALTRLDGTLVPTLAGWLALAEYPQEHFPNLNVTFVHYPSNDPGEATKEGKRVIDDRAFNGPLPRLLPDVLHGLRVNMLRGASEGASFDEWEYPEAAMRECVVNALVHRDYSHFAQGTAVQIELFPDRLVIKSPGGLYGTIHEDDLGTETVSSTRNEALVRLLSDLPDTASGVPLCQNRGMGVPTMVAAVRAAQLRPPIFRDRLRNFQVRFPSTSLLAADTLEWLAANAPTDLTQDERVALALAHSEGQVSNSSLCRATGGDSQQARSLLGKLTDRGLLRQQGQRRWTTYVLGSTGPSNAPADGGGGTDDHLSGLSDVLADVVRLVGEKGEIQRSDLERPPLNLKKATARYRVKRLVAMGVLVPTEQGRKKTVRYRLATPPAVGEQMSLHAP